VQFVDTIAHHTTSSPGFGYWPIHVDFVVKIKVAMGQVYRPVLRIAPIKIITTLLHKHILSKSGTGSGLSPSTSDYPRQNHHKSAPYTYFVLKWHWGRFIAQYFRSSLSKSSQICSIHICCPKVALGQVYRPVLRIAPIKIITTLLHTHILF